MGEDLTLDGRDHFLPWTSRAEIEGLILQMAEEITPCC